MVDFVEETRLHLLNEQLHPEIAPHTCVYCRRITRDSFQSAVEASDQIVRTETSIGKEVEDSKIYLEDILNAARAGCTLCQSLICADTAIMLSDVFMRLWAEEDRYPTDYEKAAFVHDPRLPDVIASLKEEREDWVGVRCVLQTSNNIAFRPARSRIHLERLTEKGSVLERIALCAAPGTRLRPLTISQGIELLTDTSPGQRPSPAFIPPLEFPANLLPGSELSMLRARRWIEDCETTHEQCASYFQPFCPRRVLQISEDGLSLRLIEPGTSCRYTALSYCWGGDQPAKTTQGRLKGYSQYIACTELPQTIQDAVKVTKSLRIPYLWVDAMCIVQDDEEDITEQIAEMHGIYRGAVITIAAVVARTSRDGFLHPLPQHRPILIDGSDDYGKPLRLLGSLEFSRRWGPLHNRAWALQEGCVATRLLLFNDCPMEFRCLQLDHIESYAQVTGFQDVCASPGLKILDGQKHPYGWGWLITHYSRLQLSKEQDRLPAIAALAEEYASRYLVTGYLAGLWREDLLLQLMWQPEFSMPRPKTYCGPSWSWCSAFAHVHFPWYDYDCKVILMASVTDVSVELRSPKVPYGQVTAGRLVLTGPVKQFIWVNGRGYLENGVREVDCSAEKLAVNRGVHSNTSVYMDESGKWSEDAEVCFYAIELARGSRPEENPTSRALLLEEVTCTGDRERTFRRVGLLSYRWYGYLLDQITLEELFKGAVPTQVVII